MKKNNNKSIDIKKYEQVAESASFNITKVIEQEIKTILNNPIFLNENENILPILLGVITRNIFFQIQIFKKMILEETGVDKSFNDVSMLISKVLETLPTEIKEGVTQ